MRVIRVYVLLSFMAGVVFATTNPEPFEQDTLVPLYHRMVDRYSCIYGDEYTNYFTLPNPEEVYFEKRDWLEACKAAIVSLLYTEDWISQTNFNRSAYTNEFPVFTPITVLTEAGINNGYSLTNTAYFGWKDTVDETIAVVDVLTCMRGVFVVENSTASFTAHTGSSEYYETYSGSAEFWTSDNSIWNPYCSNSVIALNGTTGSRPPTYDISLIDPTWTSTVVSSNYSFYSFVYRANRAGYGDYWHFDRRNSINDTIIMGFTYLRYIEEFIYTEEFDEGQHDMDNAASFPEIKYRDKCNSTNFNFRTKIFAKNSNQESAITNRVQRGSTTCEPQSTIAYCYTKDVYETIPTKVYASITTNCFILDRSYTSETTIDKNTYDDSSIGGRVWSIGYNVYPVDTTGDTIDTGACGEFTRRVDQSGTILTQDAGVKHRNLDVDLTMHGYTQYNFQQY